MFRKLMIAVAAAAATLGACAANDKEEAGLNDMQIAHTAYTAGLIDIRYAHLALAISDNENVRNFAETMLRDHKAVNDAALDLLNKLQATPEANATSESLMQQAAKKRAELIALSGVDFDKAYAANELAYHQFVNATVENTFIPSAKNEAFKALLGVALKTFKTHEEHAEALVAATH